MTARKLGLGLATLAVLAAPATATPLPRYGAFVFSNLCTDPQGGDVGGERLTLVRLDGNDVAYFEWGEGGQMGAPADVITMGPGDRFSITFTRQGPGPKQFETVKGLLSAERFTLTDFTADSGHNDTLPRIRDLGRKISTCK